MGMIDKSILIQFALISLLLSFFNDKLVFIFIVVFLLCWLFSYKYKKEWLDNIRLFLPNILILVSSVLIIVIIIEVSLHIFQPGFLRLEFSITGDISDLVSRKYLTYDIFKRDYDKFRILGIGDSFAVCLRESKRNYHDFLEKYLNEVGYNVEVINFGVDCVGPGYYWHMLSKYGDLIKPDLVLIGFFIGNDFREMDFNEIRRGIYIYEPINNIQRIINYRNINNLWTYQFVKRKCLIIWDNFKKLNEVKSGKVKEAGSLSLQAFLEIERQKLWMFDKDQIFKLDKIWNEKSSIMLNMKQWCECRKIKFVIAILPDQIQVDYNLRQNILIKNNIEEANMDIAYPNKLVYNFCLNHNIYCIDLLEQFQTTSNLNQYYIINDTHWNEEGNKLAGKIIIDYMINNNLISR